MAIDKAANKHRPTRKVELGYSRRVCGYCGTDWPCPTFAQAAAKRAARA